MGKNYPTNNSGIKSGFLSSLLRNGLVTLICLGGIGASLLFFRRDFNRTMQQMEEKPVGNVFYVNKTAQRYSAHYQKWERIQRHTPIYNGDILNSAVLSALKISFENGEILELSDNSSVKIAYNNEEPHFELHEGEIQVQSNRSGLTVAVHGRSAGSSSPGTVFLVTLEPKTSADIEIFRETADASETNVSAVSDVPAGCIIKVFQGSAELSSGGESRKANAGNSLRTGADGTFLDTPPLLMLSPRNGTRLLRSEHGKAPVKFQWQFTGIAGSPVENRGVMIEVSDTRNFTNLTGSLYSENTDFAEIELSEGTYYWKVFLPPAIEEIDSGRLDIIYTPGPRALSPGNETIQTVQRGDQDIRFSWSVPEEAEAVLLEVASNPQMTRPRFRQLINRTKSGMGTYVTSELEPGQWYWRIHPVYPGGVTQGEMLSSQPGSAQTFWRIRPVNADVIADDLPSPVNSFTITEDEGQSKSRKSGAPAYNNEPGNSPRILFPPDNFTMEASRTPDIFFSWKNPLSYEARFQIAERSDFSGSLIMDEKVFGSNMRGQFLTPGTYYWRVTGVSQAGSGESQPSRLVITHALEAPRLDTPRENERMIIEEGKAVSFSWERMNYANYYTFKLFIEGTENPVSEISSLRPNTIQVFFDTGTQGRFYWTVQGFTSPTEYTSGRNGMIAHSRFTIPPQGNAAQGNQSWSIPRIANIQTFSGEVHSPITLISPRSGVNVSGIQALRNPQQVRWNTDEPLRNVQLIVSRTSDPSSDPRALVKDISSSSVTFPPLSEGIWYWIIRGDTNTGRGATPGDPFWINVLPIPLLPAPEPLMPVKNSVIDIAQLTRDRSITFRWNEIEDANNYIFSFFRAGNPPVQLITLPPSDSLEYVLENLTLLNHGDYLWQVEAVYLNLNGEIEQRGVIEQNAISIDIQRSTNLQTTDLGVMYGN